MTARIRVRVSRSLLCIALAPILLCGIRPLLGQIPARRQSPLEIPSAAPYDNRTPAFNDVSALQKPITLTLKNAAGGPLCDQADCKGRTLARKWATIKAYPPKDAAPRILFGKDWYVLSEFHFHTPAEHIVDGDVAQMEVHFVFRREGAPPCDYDTFLVIGQRIRKGDENAELNKIFGRQVNLPMDYHSPYATVKDFIPGKVLVGLDRSYRYFGSLTAPADLKPHQCPPGNPVRQLSINEFPQVVFWVLLEPTIQMSDAQIARFKKVFPEGNARPVKQSNKHVFKTFRR